uniref:Uncharacterized protein n=1 Tax=Physcomitrium patens TaxID=3218 RepID=A0A2K1K662_PHYPA|nr:hypothetical protein PHYPA_011165 [Physcomitrium patens]
MGVGRTLRAVENLRILLHRWNFFEITSTIELTRTLERGESGGGIGVQVDEGRGTSQPRRRGGQGPHC